MKRILVVLLALALIASLLGACERERLPGVSVPADLSSAEESAAKVSEVVEESMIPGEMTETGINASATVTGSSPAGSQPQPQASSSRPWANGSQAEPSEGMGGKTLVSNPVTMLVGQVHTAYIGASYRAETGLPAKTGEWNCSISPAAGMDPAQNQNRNGRRRRPV